MHKYELMYITRPDLDEDALKSIREKVKDVITKNGGKVTEETDMGKRRFAYPINHLREGVYTVVNYESGAELNQELDRVLKIESDIIRHMVINLDDKK